MDFYLADDIKMRISDILNEHGFIFKNTYESVASKKIMVTFRCKHEHLSFNYLERILSYGYKVGCYVCAYDDHEN